MDLTFKFYFPNFLSFSPCQHWSWLIPQMNSWPLLFFVNPLIRVVNFFNGVRSWSQPVLFHFHATLAKPDDSSALFPRSNLSLNPHFALSFLQHLRVHLKLEDSACPSNSKHEIGFFYWPCTCLGELDKNKNFYLFIFYFLPPRSLHICWG